METPAAPTQPGGPARASTSAESWLASVSGIIVVKVISLVASVIVARAIGPGGRGVVASAMLWPTFILTIGCVTGTQTCTYFASRFGAAGFRACIYLALWNAAILLAIAYGVNWLALGQSYQPSYRLANIYTFAIPLTIITQVMAGALLAEGRFGAFWATSALQATAATILVILLLAIDRLSTTTYLAALLLALPLGAVFAERSQRLAAPTIQKPDGALAAEIIRYGGKSLLVSLPHQVNSRVDQLLMTMMVAPQVLGRYAVAVNWCAVLATIGTGLTTVVLSHSSRVDTTNEAEIDGAMRKLRRASIVLLVVGVVVMIVAPLGIPLVFGSGFRGAVAPAMILSIAYILLHVKLLLHDFARGLGYAGLPSIPEATGTVIIIPLLLWLLPAYGDIGAAVAALVSYAVVLAMLIWWIVRHIPGVTTSMVVPRAADFIALRETFVSLGVRTLRAALVMTAMRPK